MTATFDPDQDESAQAEPGRVLTLDIGPPAHGGHCVARWEGRVIFVRHAIAGERARVRITDTSHKSYWRGDAVEILTADPERIESPWPAAGPDGVGGAELAHMTLSAQRRWKTAVLREQFTRLAEIETSCEIEAIPGDDETAGMGWRTRISLIADEHGRVGMRKHHSHEIVPLTDMPLATAALQDLLVAERVFSFPWRPGTELHLVDPSGGDALLFAGGKPWRRGRPDRRSIGRRVREVVQVGEDEWHYRVNAMGFWQIHRRAPAVLVGAVLAELRTLGDLAGLNVLDLYSGAGLFTLPLAQAVTSRGSVIAVESGAEAVKDARRNLAAHEQATLEHDKVDRSFRRGALASYERMDAVVLDPPRTGAGREVVDSIANLQPQAVIYVACDPAALARDVKYFAQHGYQLQRLRSFDLFPATHHMESVALLTPINSSPAP